MNILCFEHKLISIHINDHKSYQVNSKSLRDDNYKNLLEYDFYILFVD